MLGNLAVVDTEEIEE